MRFQPIFSSDIGHWDVLDIKSVLLESHHLADGGIISDADYRDFVFTYPARLHLKANRDFFKRHRGRRGNYEVGFNVMRRRPGQVRAKTRCDGLRRRALRGHERHTRGFCSLAIDGAVTDIDGWRRRMRALHA